MTEKISQFKRTLIEKLNTEQKASDTNKNNGGALYAAVLIPFTLNKGEISLIFTKRSTDLEHHRGQISFPGGVMEPTDANLEDTVLREMGEEIGIPREQVEVLGSLDAFNSSTGFFIKPFVGWILSLNGISRNITEVEKIFYVPFDWLSDPQNAELRDFHRNESDIVQAWFYHPYLEETIWGITAGIIQELLTRIKK